MGRCSPISSSVHVFTYASVSYSMSVPCSFFSTPLATTSLPPTQCSLAFYVNYRQTFLSMLFLQNTSPAGTSEDIQHPNHPSSHTTLPSFEQAFVFQKDGRILIDHLFLLLMDLSMKATVEQAIPRRPKQHRPILHRSDCLRHSATFFHFSSTVI